MAGFVAQHQVGILGFAEIVGQAAVRFVLPGGRSLFLDYYVRRVNSKFVVMF